MNSCTGSDAFYALQSLQLGGTTSLGFYNKPCSCQASGGSCYITLGDHPGLDAALGQRSALLPRPLHHSYSTIFPMTVPLLST